MSQSRRACLADFGLATTKDTMSYMFSTTTTSRATGTLRWQAPELLDPDLDEHKCINSPASDIYAYACVCYEVWVQALCWCCLNNRWQIFSGQLPFYDIRSDYRVMAAVTNSARPPRPLAELSRIRGLDNTIWATIESCWSQRPSDHPSSRQIVDRLHCSLGMVDDHRPFDNYDTSFPARAAYSQAKHSFSSLIHLEDIYHYSTGVCIQSSTNAVARDSFRKSKVQYDCGLSVDHHYPLLNLTCRH